jgi:hypothetical protein
MIRGAASSAQSIAVMAASRSIDSPIWPRYRRAWVGVIRWRGSTD